MPAPPPPSRKKKAPRHGSSLPLLAFAGAKKTTYDPRVAKQKASNLAAKRVNDFRKLKARLAAEGKLAVPSSIAWATMDAAAAAEGGGEEEVGDRFWGETGGEAGSSPCTGARGPSPCICARNAASRHRS